MADVVISSNALYIENNGVSISQRYKAPNSIIKMASSILYEGWEYFETVVKMQSSPLSNDSTIHSIYPSFHIEAITKSLVYWGGIKSLKFLFESKDFIPDIYQVGITYKSKFQDCHTSASYDNLLKNANIMFLNLR